MLNPPAREETLVVVYFLIGGACLIIGQLIGWWMGYGRGKKDALRDLQRAELHNRRRKIAAQNRTKKPVKTGQGRNKKP